MLVQQFGAARARKKHQAVKIQNTAEMSRP
jgi:hypothetical protein